MSPTHTTSFTPLLGSERSLAAIHPCQLDDDQRHAYDITLQHLEKTLNSESPGPLRMILQGEGGTGKSKVIQTVTEAFFNHGIAHML